MNNIKTHCYVTYESAAVAEKTREALYGLRWPELSVKNLAVEFSDKSANQVCFFSVYLGLFYSLA